MLDPLAARCGLHSVKRYIANEINAKELDANRLRYMDAKDDRQQKKKKKKYQRTSDRRKSFASDRRKR
jgi:hypothetical protein